MFRFSVYSDKGIHFLLLLFVQTNKFLLIETFPFSTFTAGRTVTGMVLVKYIFGC